MKRDNNKNIFCSVSAGYSSVMMAIKMKEWYPDHNIINVMANTSKERIESLEFMDNCDKYFGLDLIWVEAIFCQEKGVGVDYAVVDYKDLKTKGEIFENGIRKFGIPSVANKWCNRDLKTVPLKKYADDVFGLNSYSIAVGIRIDEIDRVSKSYQDNNIFYPLVENKIDTRQRNEFWNKSPIKIGIPAFKGNCDLCFEKSRRKILTIIKDEPQLAKWWQEMERKYSDRHVDGKPTYNGLIDKDGGHYFGRGNTSINYLIEMARHPFSKATDEYIYENDLFDFENNCGVACSVF